MFILGQLPQNKIYPSEEAIEELERLTKNSLNEIEKTKQKNLIVCSLNVRSLVKHYNNIQFDLKLRGDVIALQETWCLPEQDNLKFSLSFRMCESLFFLCILPCGARFVFRLTLNSTFLSGHAKFFLSFVIFLFQPDLFCAKL